MGRIEGRKSLVWLSSGFPLQLYLHPTTATNPSDLLNPTYTPTSKTTDSEFSGAGRAIAKVLHELDLVRARRRALIVATARGTAFWCVVVASQWCYMRGVGIRVPLGYAAAAVTVVSLITMLPISLGGYGVREGGFSFFLAVGGMATISQGVGVGLCVTAQTMAFGLLGIPVYLTLRQRRARAPVSAPTIGAMACAS